MKKQAVHFQRVPQTVNKLRRKDLGGKALTSMPEGLGFKKKKKEEPVIHFEK